MLLTELPRGDLVPLFKGADQMTAVRKAGLGCNIVQVIVGKKKQVFNLVQADKLDILLTALPVMLQKKFGKIGVAHVVFMCQCLDIDVFLGMAVEIDEDILHTLFSLSEIDSGLKQIPWQCQIRRSRRNSVEKRE